MSGIGWEIDIFSPASLLCPLLFVPLQEKQSIMKRIILSITALLIALSTWATSDLTLEQIVSGDFFPDEYPDLVPLQDGESFARLSDDSKQIVK